MRTVLRNTKQGLLVISLIVAGSWPLVGFGQTDEAQDESLPKHMKFNTDSVPQNTEQRPAYNFKVEPTDKPLEVHNYDSSSDDEGFKTYLGYPKHRFNANIAYNTIASDWNYNGSDYTYTANTIAYNVNYWFVMTPQWSFGLDYTHYGLSVSGSAVTPLISVASSSENYDEYYAKAKYCSISSTNFYQQVCYGFDLGNSAYPVLGYVSSTTLALSKVQDIIAGLNISGQTPFSSFLAKGILGFNYGTGLGNSGYLTSKSDYDLYATAQIEYFIDPNKHHDIIAGVDYHYRNAQVSGLTPGGITDTWSTKLGVYGGRIGYAYMFP